MPGPIWAKLTPTEQEVWDKLSDNTKLLILNARLWGDTSQCPPPAPNYKKGKQNINLHDLIQACYNITLGDADDVQDDVEANDTSLEQQQDDSPEEPADLLAYAAHQQSIDEIPPAHLAKMLSNTINRYAKKPGKSKTTLKTNVCIVESTSGTYSVSRREVVSASAGTLIDGGSNGGLAGAELRVIEVYDNGRTVDVEGIGNHRINRIPLGSAGGVYWMIIPVVTHCMHV